ncbi:MAG: hypothetical protein DRR04_04555 [Gammaproteobacteria bacterium]|nr:MAG: hypothetical protein DRR04_04555 [Gammaproteobacteria bacterium]
MAIDMTEQDYELLSQYLDGELAAPAAQELRKRLIADPALRESLERLQKVNNRVKDAFDVPGADTVPPRIVTILKNARTRRGRLSQQQRAGWGLAVAASLVVASGLLLMPDWHQQTGESLAVSAGDDALLAHELETSPSRGDGWDTLSDGRQVRPLLSFANTQGGWCREYLLSEGGGMAWHGVACRTEGQWTTEVLNTEELAGSINEYRPAGVANSDQITSFIATHSAGIALSLKQEADLIARNWQ